MSDRSSISLYENENEIFEKIKAASGKTGAAIVRKALDMAFSNPQLFQTFLDQRTADPNDFNPDKDGFNSTAFINTLCDFVDDTWETCFDMIINTGISEIRIPAQTAVNRGKVGDSCLVMHNKHIEIQLPASRIAQVELYDTVTSKVHPYRNYAKKRWPKNFCLLITTCGEEGSSCPT